MAPTYNTTLFFGRDFNNTQCGEPVEGGEVTVYYDPCRMQEIYEREDDSGRTGMITCHYSVDGATPKTVKLLKQSRSSGAVRSLEPQAQTIKLPLGAERMELWFLGEAAGMDDQYDSNLGLNYVVLVRPRS